MTLIIFGNSSCIIFAVVRSTLWLLSFHLHSLCLRIQPVCPQCFDDFCSYAATVHVAFLLCVQYFVGFALVFALFLF